MSRNRQQAERIKELAQAASEARMEDYMTMERQRLAAIRQSEKMQQSKDRRLFFYVALLAMVILVILISVALATLILP